MQPLSTVAFSRMASSESLIESAKRAAAYAAVDAYIKPEYKRIGIGSGA